MRYTHRLIMRSIEQSDLKINLAVQEISSGHILKTDGRTDRQQCLNNMSPNSRGGGHIILVKKS